MVLISGVLGVPPYRVETLREGTVRRLGSAEGDLTVANLNTLHGFACDPLFPGDGDQCRLIDRIDLLIQHLASICPDVVTLQEAVTSRFLILGLEPPKVVAPLESTVQLIEERLEGLAKACGFPYAIVFLPVPPFFVDQELILTRYPPRRITSIPLYSPLRPFFTRHLLYAQIDHPIGPIDVFTTHVGGGEPCGFDPMLLPWLRPPPCPEECETSQTVRECQARQVALRVEAMHHGSTPAVIAGDFNFEPDAPAYQELLGHGWIDSYLAAGNPECDPQTEIGCTSGRIDYALDDLESPEDNVDVRVDYTFVVPPKRKLICSIDPAGTRLFADDPAVACGPVPNPICWPSDHKGTELELNCKRRPPRGAAQEVRALDQPQDRQGPRPHDSAVPALAGGQGDQVSSRRLDYLAGVGQ
ncbi:MAG: endonuclease/exonuclease/phosphatase family protein [Candidatus Methylomirabilales bacterium]